MSLPRTITINVSLTMAQADTLRELLIWVSRMGSPGLGGMATDIRVALSRAMRPHESRPTAPVKEGTGDV